MNLTNKKQKVFVIPAKAGIQFTKTLLFRGNRTITDDSDLDPCLHPKGTSFSEAARRDDKQKGFAQLMLVGAIVLIVGLFAFLFFFFKQNNERLGNFVSSDIPPGVVTDAQGLICETQDANYCHESPDIETWKDDGLP